MINLSKLSKKLVNTFAAAVLVTAQMTPFFIFNVQKVFATSGDITAGTHQGQNSDDSWSPGNNTQYSEGDYVNFQFTLTSATDNAEGQMYVEFEKSCSGGAEFFTDFFEVVSVTPSIATVVPNGTPTGDDYQQVLDLDFTSAGSAVVVYTLQVSDIASGCNGSSSHVGLGATDTPGDYSNTGREAIPAPANVYESPSLTVTKTVSSGTALPSDFSFTVSPAIDGQSAYTIPSGESSFTITDINPDGVYAVTESGPAGYVFTAGSGSSCLSVDSSIGTATGQMKATVTAGETATDATCNFTNARSEGKLKVIKNVVNGNGGTKTFADFSFTVDGQNYAFEETTSPDGERTISLPTGTYSVVEPEANSMGYATSYSNSQNKNSDCTELVVVAGETATCTIENNDQPGKLKIVKKVVNDSGGTATPGSFTMYVNDSERTQDKYYSANQGTSYNITESGPDGYKLTDLSCEDDNTSSPVSHPVSLNLEQSVTCTLTNNDITSTLTLIKTVINNSGGTDIASAWTLIAQEEGESPIIEEQGTIIPATNDLQAITSTVSVTAGVFYDLSESGGPSGYTASDWECDGGTLEDRAVSLALAAAVTCTITNDDQQSYVIVDKTVDNSNGGTAKPDDFKLTVNGSAVSDEVKYAVNPGTHTVGETNLPGYIAGDWGGDCDKKASVTVALGETKTCTITNTAQQSYVVVDKTVKNDNGGKAKPDDFKLTVNGSATTDETKYAVNPGTHTVGETTLPGYTAGDWGGDCGNDAKVTVALGETKTCTITNDDEAPTLKLVKKVTNDNGGTATSSDWDLTARRLCFNGDTNPDCGFTDKGDSTTFHNVKAGAPYNLSESGPDGYAAGSWKCDGGTILGTKVSLKLDEDVTCTVTNLDIAPTLTLKKIVVNDDGGLATQDNFQPWITDVSVSWDKSYGVKANQYIAISEQPLYGGENYSRSDWECDGGTLDGDKIMLTLDEDVTCTITNDDPKIAINVVKDGPETAVAGSKVKYTFTVTNDGDVALKDVTVNDSITGEAVYVSGDSNNDSYLDLDETWLYEAEYDIPLNQVQPVNNTVTACGYELLRLPNIELNTISLLRDFDESEEQPEQEAVCDEDDHSLTIPQVLAEVKVLEKTGNQAYMAVVTGLLLAGLTLSIRKFTPTSSKK